MIDAKDLDEAIRSPTNSRRSQRRVEVPAQSSELSNLFPLSKPNINQEK